MILMFINQKKIPTKRYNQKVSENQICLVLERLAEEIN